MKKQNFLKGSVILMFSAVIAKILGAVFRIPLTNMLGGVGMSYFSSSYSLFMPVYALTTTGLSASVARMTTKSTALGMYGNARRIYRTAHVLFGAFGLLGSCIIVLLAKPFSISVTGEPQAALAAAMIAPSVLFGCTAAVERGYYEGLGNMYPTAFSQAAEGMVKALAGLFLCRYVIENSEKILPYFPYITDIRAVAAAAGVLGVTLSTFGAIVFFMIFGIFRKKEKGTESYLVSRRDIIRELLETAIPVGAAAVVTNIAALVDMWTITGCIPFEIYRSAGISAESLPEFVYGSFSGIVLTVFNLVPSVTNMLGKGILPCITEAWENNDKEFLRKNTVQALFTAALIAVPSAVGLGILSGEVLTFLFPNQSDEVGICTEPLEILMPGMVCLCVSYPVSSMLQAVGKSFVSLKIMLAGTILKLIGNLVLIPFIGLNGAAISTTVVYIFILVFSLFSYIKYTHIKLDIKSFLAVLYSGIMCGAAAWLTADISESLNMGLLCRIILSAVSGGGMYILFIYLSVGKSVLHKIKIRRSQ